MLKQSNQLYLYVCSLRIKKPHHQIDYQVDTNIHDTQIFTFIILYDKFHLDDKITWICRYKLIPYIA